VDFQNGHHYSRVSYSGVLIFAVDH
jgi:hypothetical protein